MPLNNRAPYQTSDRHRSHNRNQGSDANVPTIPFEMYSLLEEFHDTGREPTNGYEAGLAGRDPEG